MASGVLPVLSYLWPRTPVPFQTRSVVVQGCVRDPTWRSFVQSLRSHGRRKDKGLPVPSSCCSCHPDVCRDSLKFVTARSYQMAR